MENGYLGNKIHELRKSKGMTQDQLAEKLGISFQAVSKWENGIAYPDITMLPELSKIFDVKIDVFFNEEAQMASNVEVLDTTLVEQDKFMDVVAQVDEASMETNADEVSDSDEVNTSGEGHGVKLNWEDDGKLRAVLFRGHQLVKNTKPNEYDLLVTVEGDLQDLISDFNVECNNVYGNATAGDAMECNDVYGSASAGDGLSCNNIKGSATAGDGIECNNIGGNATAGDSIECNEIGGKASAGGEIVIG